MADVRTPRARTAAPLSAGSDDGRFGGMSRPPEAPPAAALNGSRHTTSNRLLTAAPDEGRGTRSAGDTDELTLDECNPANDPRIGSRLNNYQITGILGRGGMGVVYEAENVLLKRRAAIKLMPPERAGNERAVQRFLQEAQSAARLNHPNAVGIYDVGQVDGTIYIAMELVRGGNAEEFLETRGRFHWKEGLRIAADACRALTAAHSAGLIHRDIKPANIMRADDGAVKITDFGLAKQTDNSGKQLTAATKILGTPHYLSPEQARVRPLDARSDLYSLGATLYALVTGVPPFDKPGGALDIILAHCNEPAPDPRVMADDIPESVALIILKAMAKEPADRYQSAEDMRLDIETVLAAAVDVDSGSHFGWSSGRAVVGSGSSSALKSLTSSGSALGLRPVPKPDLHVGAAAVAGSGARASGGAGMPTWAWASIGAGVAAVLGLVVLPMFGGGSTRAADPAVPEVKPDPKSGTKPGAGTPDGKVAVLPPGTTSKTPPPPPGGNTKTGTGIIPVGPVDPVPPLPVNPKTKTPKTNPDTPKTDPVPPPPAGNTIPPERAGEFLNTPVTVAMTVRHVGKSMTGTFWYMNSDANYRSKENLAVAVNVEGRNSFKTAGIETYEQFEARHLGKPVRVSGTVTQFRGSLQIIVSSADQVVLAE